MKIAIHHRPGSFSDRWIAYCQQKSIDYKIVNCYDSDIVEQVKDCDALMWHHHHADYKDALTGKRRLILDLFLILKSILRFFLSSLILKHRNNNLIDKQKK